MQIETTYQEAMARSDPEPLVIAIAQDRQGKPNPITMAWVMRTSHDPPLLAISVGLTRYSLDAIRHAREFVVSFPSSTMVEDAVFHGTRSGRDLDKLAACGTQLQPAKIVKGVLLADAVANFECVLESELQTGDHVIFVGRIVAAHMNADETVRRLYTLGDDRLGGVVPG